MKDGGPAFPHSQRLDTWGMSLRVWFAGQALPEVMVKHRWVENISIDGRIIHLGSPDAIAGDCYKIADAMLKAQEAENGT